MLLMHRSFSPSEKRLTVGSKSHLGKPDFHGSSAASLVDPTSVTNFMGGLLSIATV